MRIYTRGGDGGETSIRGGRVGKAHARVKALGAVDELNASLGWAAAQLGDGPTRDRLEALQHDLFALGAELAMPRTAPDPTATESEPRAPDGAREPALPPERITEMERWIDELDAELPELRAFILPGGAAPAAALHLARTVCRRAERAVVRLSESEAVRPGAVAYLNRLSDLLFVLARAENRRSGRRDVEWLKP